MGNLCLTYIKEEKKDEKGKVANFKVSRVPQNYLSIRIHKIWIWPSLNGPSRKWMEATRHVLILTIICKHIMDGCTILKL